MNHRALKCPKCSSHNIEVAAISSVAQCNYCKHWWKCGRVVEIVPDTTVDSGGPDDFDFYCAQAEIDDCGDR